MKHPLRREGASDKNKPSQTFPPAKPKILFFDLENSPNLGYSWDKYEQDILRFKKEWFLLSFAAKWKESRVFAKALPDYGGYAHNKTNDEHLVRDIWRLFDEADIIVAHNGKKHDIRKANARFAFYGLKPPSPYKVFDTLQHAWRVYKFNSNKLDDLGNYLGLGRKIATGGADLWFDCMKGDPKAWKKMVRYNKQDVVLLEKVYNHFLPWAEQHPNLGVYASKEACPKCGSTHMISRGFARTVAGWYRQFQCRDCGGWSRAGKLEQKIKTLR